MIYTIKQWYLDSLLVSLFNTVRIPNFEVFMLVRIYLKCWLTASASSLPPPVQLISVWKHSHTVNLYSSNFFYLLSLFGALSAG